MITQLIASYELAIGCECTATLSPICPVRPGFFLPGENMKYTTSAKIFVAALIIAFTACSVALYVVVS
ncbi:hypothetical protein [Citrobacter portucalensis]|uniref:hypothetical protein n=1 Tax=Citrobacter portucalensis TaxID=1639133 RepID=UPI0040339C77